MSRVALILAVLAVSLPLFADASYAEDMRTALPASELGQSEAGRMERNVACCPQKCCPPPCCIQPQSCLPCGWKATVSLGAWVFGMEGQTTIRGRRMDVSSTPADSIEALVDHGDSVFTGRLLLTNGRWSFRLAGVTLGLSGTKPFVEGGARGIDAEISLDLVQADVGYRIGRTYLGGTCACPKTITYDAFVGLRYFNVESSISARVAAIGVSGSKDILDPIVGARATWDLGNRWSFGAEADIGGFGVGSELTWGMRAVARFQVAPWFSADVGYKLIDIDYTSGSGASRFEFDMLLHGPFVAFNFHF
jgi:hypothetical protein